MDFVLINAKNDYVYHNIMFLIGTNIVESHIKKAV